MVNKISKVKYSLMNLGNICPECHKDINDKWFIPASLKDWSAQYTNTCPHCHTSFDNTQLILFPHLKKVLPDAPDALCELIDNCFNMTINANDFFHICCADDEDIEEDIIALYLTLTLKENMPAQETLYSLLEWKRGYMRWGRKLPSKELKKIRKLTGFKWYPLKEDNNV